MGSPVPGGTAGDCSAADQHRSPVDWLGDLEQRRHRDRRRPDRLGRSRGRAASAHPGCGRRHRRRRPRGEPGWRPGHARADRRPYPPGVRGQPLGGARHAVQRLVARRDRRRGRRRRVHRHRDPRHRPLDAVQRRARPAGPLAAVRHDDPRGQDRIPPDQGRRAGRRADAARARRRAGHAAGARHVHGRARGPAGVLRPPPRLYRRGQLLVRGRGRHRRGQRGRVLRGRPVLRGRGALDPQRGPPLGPAAASCTPAGTPAPARPGWPPS